MKSRLPNTHIFARRASCSIGNTVFPIEKNRPHQHSRVSEACSILSYKPLPVILPSGYSPEILFTSLIVSSYNDSRCSCKGYDQKCAPKCHIRCISRLWSCYTLFLLLGICRIVLCCLVILSVVAVVLLIIVIVVLLFTPDLFFATANFVVAEPSVQTISNV